MYIVFQTLFAFIGADFSDENPKECRIKGIVFILILNQQAI